MDGHSTKPPNRQQFNAITLQNQSILCGMEIKQEPTIKQENEVSGEILMVSRPIHTAIASRGSSTGGKEVDDSNDCFDFYDLDEVKSEVKIEKVRIKVNQVPGKSCSKDQTPRNNARKRYSKGKKQKSGVQIYGNVEKNATTATEKERKMANLGGKKVKTEEVKTNEKRHKCSLCDYVTDIKTNLKTHMLKHTGDKPFPCSMCPKRFTQKQHLQSHMKTHVDEFLFSCSNCLQEFHRSDEKVEHETGCKIRRYECHLCREISSLVKTDLKRHLRVHTGERPFECDQCLKRFKQASALESHRKTHTNPRPRPFKIKCSSCFRNFAQQKEKETHEVNCKRRGYRCDLCKTFTTDQKGDLMKHMRVHTGEKPFRCETCSKCFSRNANLNQHQKVHK